MKKRNIAFLLSAGFLFTSCGNVDHYDSLSTVVGEENNDVVLEFDHQLLKANEPNVIVTDIVGHNLSLEDSINIVYYVENTVDVYDSKGLLIWDEAQDEYTIDSSPKFNWTACEDYNRGGTTYDAYYFNKVAAKEMTDYFYAVSYVAIDGEYSYSPVDRYSVLDYCYNKKGSTSTVNGGTGTLGSLISSILDYGASSQKYFNYNTQRLANYEYFRITVENGTLDDGFDQGLFNSKQKANVVVSEFDQTTDDFYYWVMDRLEVGSSESSSLDLSNVHSDVTIKAVIKDKEYWSRVLAKDPSETFVYVPKTIRDINYYDSPFRSNDVVTDIVIPHSVTSLNQQAIRGCPNLKTIYLPLSITKLGSDSFNNCANVVIYAESNTVMSGWYASDPMYTPWNTYRPYVLGSRGPESNVIIDGVEYAFGNADGKNICILIDGSGLTSESLMIPKNVKGIEVVEIATRAFYNNQVLNEISVPSSVKEISREAFRACYKLKTVELEEGLNKIDYGAFYYCWTLSNIKLPDSISYLGDYCFNYCNALPDFYFPENLSYLGQSVYSNIDTSVVEADDNAVFINVEDVAGSLFSSNRRIKNVVLGNKCKTIGSFAFSNCKNLESIQISNSVESIGYAAFTGSPIKFLFLPESVQTLNYWICDYNVVVYCASETKPDGWKDSPNRTGTVLFGSKGEESNIVIDHVVYSKHLVNGNYEYCVLGPDDTSPENVAVRDYIDGLPVTSVACDAFAYNKTIKSIYLPETIREIGQRAFYALNYAKLYIPSSVEKMGSYPISSCVVYCGKSGDAIPDGWDSTWNSGNPTVYWNYSPEDFLNLA